MTVDTATLRRACEILITHLESRGRSSIELERDHYWEILAEKRYDSYAEPKTFTVGQLSDDYQEVDRIARGESEPLIYALVWLGSIMRAVGDTIPE